MSTHIVLEDGRVLGVSNGQFDGILEAVADHLRGEPGAVPELAGWLLEQRCEVQGPGVGYLDLRELAPSARSDIRIAAESIHRREESAHEPALPEWLGRLFSELAEMWSSIERGEPPESRTSSAWRVHPASGKQLGPGW